MSKAMVIMDMPECCYECAFIDDRYDYPECTITNEIRGYNFNIREHKMDNCPLIRIFDKEDDKDAHILMLEQKLKKTDEMLSKAYQIIGEVLDL